MALSTLARRVCLPLASGLRTASRGIADGSNVEVLPRLPHVQGFLRDTRRPGEREQIGEFHTGQKGAAPLRIELADEHDSQLVSQHIAEHFMQNTPIFTALNVSYEESAPLFFGMVPPVLKKKMTPLVFDGDKLIGHGMLESVERCDFKHEFGSEPQPNPTFTLLPDYEEFIANGTWKARRSNEVWAPFLWAYQQTGKFLPADIQRLILAETIGVHPAYAKSGLAIYLISIGFQLARQAGGDYMVAQCVAGGSAHIFRKSGMNILFSMPYDKFLVGGKPLLGPMSDGHTALEVVGGYVRDLRLPHRNVAKNARQ